MAFQGNHLNTYCFARNKNLASPLNVRLHLGGPQLISPLHCSIKSASGRIVHSLPFRPLRSFEFKWIAKATQDRCIFQDAWSACIKGKPHRSRCGLKILTSSSTWFMLKTQTELSTPFCTRYSPYCRHCSRTNGRRRSKS